MDQHDDVERKLTDCFERVFPHVAASEIKTATVFSIEGWDSLATMNLLVTIQSTFELEIDDELLQHLDSFKGTYLYIQNKLN